jgi:hypothetical protein
MTKREFGPTKRTDYPPSPGYGAAGTKQGRDIFSSGAFVSFASFRVFSGQFNPSSLSPAHKSFKNPLMTADTTASSPIIRLVEQACDYRVGQIDLSERDANMNPGKLTKRKCKVP